MEKPINLIIEEFKMELVNVVNKYKIAPFIAEPILKDIHNEMCILKDKELKKASAEYSEYLKKNEENTTKN